jgi:hypothetical protein
MTTENRGGDIPDWAREERQRDIAWIRENIHTFRAVARITFTERGRGAIVVDTTSIPVEGMGHPFAYYLQNTIEETDDEDTKRMVAEYDPHK